MKIIEFLALLSIMIFLATIKAVTNHLIGLEIKASAKWKMVVNELMSMIIGTIIYILLEFTKSQ